MQGNHSNWTVAVNLLRKTHSDMQARFGTGRIIYRTRLTYAAHYVYCMPVENVTAINVMESFQACQNAVVVRICAVLRVSVHHV